MSIAGISSNLSTSLTSTMKNQFQKVRSDFDQLKQALQSGDLTKAQQAYSAIQQDSPNSANSSTSQASQDFQALGQAIQSGDLSSAQKAFQTFTQDMKAAHPHHGHHHKAGSTQQSNSSAAVDGDSNGDASDASSTIGSVINVSA